MQSHYISLKENKQAKQQTNKNKQTNKQIKNNKKEISYNMLCVVQLTSP